MAAPEAAHVDVGRLVELTKALVAVDTAYPPGNEAAVRDILHDALAAWHPTWEEVEPAARRTSFIARLPSEAAAAGGQRAWPTLIVNCHTDVVPVVASRWSRPPFGPSVEDGRLYGRGSADMKGGLAAAVCALDALAASGEKPACDIVFHFVADEERGGGLGTHVLSDQGRIAAGACLVPEPTGLSVCVAERGLAQGYITVKGKPGHGSRPREGVSAVEHAAQLVLALHGADFGDPEHPLLGKPTANVGTIEGGSALNIVAEHARIGFDRRILPGVDEKAVVTGLREHIAAAGLGDVDYEIEIEDFGEGSEMEAGHPFATLVRRCVGAVTGRPAPVIGMTFTTDARFVRNQNGIPAVVCGPGHIAQAHGIDEWVAVSQLVEATAAYAELYRSFDTAPPRLQLPRSGGA